mmetsp:Transcript_4410/g.11811  ORF Transcript_4410/g.11811 Transcript_4410/m.11811 type:complete len:387 (+) Transcript_4410:191-1351(+)
MRGATLQLLLVGHVVLKNGRDAIIGLPILVLREHDHVGGPGWHRRVLRDDVGELLPIVVDLDGDLQLLDLAVLGPLIALLVPLAPALSSAPVDRVVRHPSLVLGEVDSDLHLGLLLVGVLVHGEGHPGWAVLVRGGQAGLRVVPEFQGRRRGELAELVLRVHQHVCGPFGDLCALRQIIRRLFGHIGPLGDVFDEGAGRDLFGGRLAPVQGVLVQLVLVACPVDGDSAAELPLVAVVVLEDDAPRLRLGRHGVLQRHVARREVLAVLVLGEHQQVRRSARKGRARRDAEERIAPGRADLANERVQGRIQFRRRVLPPVQHVFVYVELVLGLRDLHLSADRALLHVGVLEADAGLLRGHAGARVLLRVHRRLPGALGAVPLLARVGG